MVSDFISQLVWKNKLNAEIQNFHSIRIDVNDHAPKFANLPYTVYVDEATPIGTTIFQQISAFDRDKPNTPNSDVQFAMQSLDYDPGGMHFGLESAHRPHVVLRRQLDFDEGKRMFEIPIVASVSTATKTTVSIVSASTLYIFSELL